MGQKSIMEFDVAAARKVIEFVQAHKDVKGGLIPTLHDVQGYFGYVPYEAQKIIAEELDIPAAEVYGVVTFYSRFTLKPTGKYKVSVCLGPACYVKGSELVLEKVQQILGVKAGDSTDDGMYSVEAIRCVGACGLAPVMMVNEDVYGKVTPDEVETILSKYLA